MMNYIYWVISLTTILTSAIGKPFNITNTTQDDFLKYYSKISGVNNNITMLHLENVNWTVLDVRTVVDAFPFLENLTVENSNILSVIPPDKINNIKILELRNLLLTNTSFLNSFPKLEIAHLEGNRLKALPTGSIPTNIKGVYLKNNRWNCFEDVTGTLELLNPNIKSDVDKLTCTDKRFEGKYLLTVAKFVKDLRQHELCSKMCNCSVIKVINTAFESSESEPIISVNCSNTQMTEMPPSIPKYTRILYLEDNEIASVSPLKNNPHYKHVWDLHLDNNKISSIGVLEGSYWLSHFRTLSLRKNNLKKLPSYALDNAFLKNPNLPILRIYLGGNPWSCDCAYTPVFQELVLQKYMVQVRDTEDVKCSYLEGEEADKPILELTRSAICKLPVEYNLQQGLDLLNAVLASLIVFILGKLVYDYYHFKKSGKLPWIIMKMP